MDAIAEGLVRVQGQEYREGWSFIQAEGQGFMERVLIRLVGMQRIYKVHQTKS